MTESAAAIRGDLQQEIMEILWRTESASVEEVRRALPRARRGAYTTVQTVLNRLSERKLVSRRKAGKALRYSAEVTEADYVARTLQRNLADVSENARRTALAMLVEDLGPDEMRAVSALASEIRARRSD